MKRPALTRFLRSGVLLGLGLFATSIGAVEWTAGTGDFNDGGNWNTGDVPDLGEEALINNGGTAQFTSDDVATVDDLRIGVDGGSGSFEQTAGTFETAGLSDPEGRAVIGDNSTGSARISGGEFLIGNDIMVGLLPGGMGQMTIDGVEALVTAGDDIQLGREGEGTLDFSAGQLRGGYTVIGKFGTGLWNQTGGLFDQDFGDVEIGDGGTPDQSGIAGPRAGMLNLTGGFFQTAGDLAIGNRRGTGSVNVSGGALAATGGDSSHIYIGRGFQSNPGTGAATELRVVGDVSMIVATGSLLMNPDEVAESSTLIAEITGSSHTPIKVSGDADIRNGDLKVELNGYTPSADDSWVLIQAGAELDADLEQIDELVDDAGYDPLTHGQAQFFGEVMAPFAATDYTMASLPAGLSWEVAYTPELVVLGVSGTVTLTGDYNENGELDVDDLNRQAVAIAGGQDPPEFDLTNDGLVDYQDRLEWVNVLKKTWIGDSNLDLEFNSSDMVQVFANGKYETEEPAGWEEGDWNADLFFDSSDMVAAFVEGGYEKGARLAAAPRVVPEPSSLLLILFGMFAVWSVRAAGRIPSGRA